MKPLDYIISPNSVKKIYTQFSNDDIIVYSVRAKGDARIFWASDYDLETKYVNTAYELGFGNGTYEVEEEKRNLAIINFSDKEQHVLIEIAKVIPDYWYQSVTATTGF